MNESGIPTKTSFQKMGSDATRSRNADTDDGASRVILLI
jgi:hypothetical protein